MSQNQVIALIGLTLFYFNHIYKNVYKYLSFEKVGFDIGDNSGLFIQVDNKLFGLPIKGAQIELYSGDRVLANATLKDENEKLNLGSNRIFISLNSLNLKGIDLNELLSFLNSGLFARGDVFTPYGNFKFNSRVI